MVRVNLRVHPRSSRNQVVGFQGDVLHVRVTAPPLDGKANQAVVFLLSEALGVSKSSIRIVRGHGSRDKSVDVDSASGEFIRERLHQVPD